MFINKPKTIDSLAFEINRFHVTASEFVEVDHLEHLKLLVAVLQEEYVGHHADG